MMSAYCLCDVYPAYMRSTKTQLHNWRYVADIDFEVLAKKSVQIPLLYIVFSIDKLLKT